MGRGILKLDENKYVEWSSVVDAPTTYIMDREEAVRFTQDEKRIIRADETGTSFKDVGGISAEEYVAFNRAGENESCISLEEIIDKYTLKEENG